MCIWAFFVLVAALVCGYLGFYHLTGLEADAAKGAGIIGIIIFLVIMVFGWRKSER